MTRTFTKTTLVSEYCSYFHLSVTNTNSKQSKTYTLCNSVIFRKCAPLTYLVFRPFQRQKAATYLETFHVERANRNVPRIKSNQYDVDRGWSWVYIMGKGSSGQ